MQDVIEPQHFLCMKLLLRKRFRGANTTLECTDKICAGFLFRKTCFKEKMISLLLMPLLCIDISLLIIFFYSFFWFSLIGNQMSTFLLMRFKQPFTIRRDWCPQTKGCEGSHQIRCQRQRVWWDPSQPRVWDQPNLMQSELLLF